MLGTVARLRRYPVKSMLGEDVAASDVTVSGLAGDRRFAVVSVRTGKLASAKYPRRWRAMLTLAATASGGAVRIRLPDGTIAAGLARHNRIPPRQAADPEPCAGVYAEVLNPGHISTSDTVRFY